MKQIAGTLLLARVATESIHGFDRVKNISELTSEWR